MIKIKKWKRYDSNTGLHIFPRIQLINLPKLIKFKEIEEYDKQISILTEENAQQTEEIKKREKENELLQSATEELEANIEELALIKHKVMTIFLMFPMDVVFL